jgi:hypothetical protein
MKILHVDRKFAIGIRILLLFSALVVPIIIANGLIGMSLSTVKDVESMTDPLFPITGLPEIERGGSWPIENL